jgi:hypothetical protein
MNTLLDSKLQDLPALVTKELQKSPTSLLHPAIDTSPTVAKLLKKCSRSSIVTMPTHSDSPSLWLPPTRIKRNPCEPPTKTT